MTDKSTGRHRALFYLDNFARAGQRSGAWATSYRSQNTLSGLTSLTSNNNNFVKGAPGEPVLISLNDAQTLFHEFGHALHGMLQEVRYRSLAPTPRDYVEFPSQFNERWLLTREVLDRFARHCKTGEPMPQTLIDRVHRSSRFNSGYGTVEYLAAAIVDMDLHTRPEGVDDIAAFEREALARIGGMPREIALRHSLTHFDHLFGNDSYSAGYYSYLWSDVMAADAWQAFEEVAAHGTCTGAFLTAGFVVSSALAIRSNFQSSRSWAMKRSYVALVAAAVITFGVGAPVVSTRGAGAQQAGGQGAPPRQWWVNKNKGGQYGKNKPHIKLSDLRARHKGQATWTEVVVEDENFHATYNSGAPGTKITPRMRPDTREFFVIVEGEMRFTVEGQPQGVVARRGSVVNIPKKTTYSAEVVGTAPALWVDANQANFKTLVPVTEARPAAAAGHTLMKIGTTFGPGVYAGNNQPHFNLFDAEKDPKFAGRNVVQDDHMWAQAIWGYEKNLPPYDPNDKGHFHVGTAEWWVIMEGQIRHNIETVGDFTSNEGDVVYAPPSTWHATRFAGPGPSCRLAISGYQFTSLLEQPQE